MDNFVQEKLQKWDLEVLQSDFEKNQIDEETFKELEEKDIKELIPILGLRKKFLKKFQVYSSINKTFSETESVASGSQRSYQSDSSDFPTESFAGGALDEFPNFDLKELLQNSALGKNIIEFYEEHKNLNDSNRSILVDIIIKHIYTYIIKRRLIHDQYILLCNKITDLFPQESSITFHISKKEIPNGVLKVF